MSSPIGQSTVIEGIDQAIQSIEEQIRSHKLPQGKALLVRKRSGAIRVEQ